MVGRFILLLLAATAATTTTATQPSACTPSTTNDPRLASYSVYVARTGDSPTVLARRFYGEEWKSYLIKNANASALTQQGTFPAGTKLLIPPDLDGKRVDVERWEKHPH